MRPCYDQRLDGRTKWLVSWVRSNRLKRKVYNKVRIRIKRDEEEKKSDMIYFHLRSIEGNLVSPMEIPRSRQPFFSDPLYESSLRQTLDCTAPMCQYAKGILIRSSSSSSSDFGDTSCQTLLSNSIHLPFFCCGHATLSEALSTCSTVLPFVHL